MPPVEGRKQSMYRGSLNSTERPNAATTTHPQRPEEPYPNGVHHDPTHNPRRHRRRDDFSRGGRPILASLEELAGGLADYFGGNQTRTHFWLADDGGLMSVAYCAPEALTDRTWNLRFTAVRPDLRGKGHGATLLRHVERTLAKRGERLLLVETSGVEVFERTRALHRRAASTTRQEFGTSTRRGDPPQAAGRSKFPSARVFSALEGRGTPLIDLI